METTQNPAAVLAAYGPEVSPATQTATRARLNSIDLLRGLVMVLMALDHTRDFFYANQFDPLDLTNTYPALFATRWITHFCAPVFVFLAGTGTFLQLYRGKSKRELSWFLVTRGFWLVVLEVTLVRWGWSFNLSYEFTMAQVIWAIGWCMMLMAALVHLPLRAVGILGVLIIALHNLLNPVVPGQFGVMGWLWLALHEGGPYALAEGRTLFFGYPLLPWVGVMASGYWFGTAVVKPAAERKPFLIWLGLGMLLTFAVIRYTNLYGDTDPWTVQKSPLFTFFSFINVQKYPPSLLYTLVTLGPAMLLLSVADKLRGPLNKVLVTFGRVPLFYYLLHLPLIHGMAWAVGFGIHFIKGTPIAELEQNWGFGLPVTYLAWLVAVIILYFPCAWFAKLKMRNKSPLLSYL